MTKIIDFTKELEKRHADQPHYIVELVCLSCLHRWIGVYPITCWLKDLICKCGSEGKIISTGQILEKDE